MKISFENLPFWIIVFAVTTALMFVKVRFQYSEKTNKEIIKTALILNSIVFLVFIIVGILDNVLPKHEVGIDIKIYNRNDSYVQININGRFYYTEKNETVNIWGVDTFSGFIAIKTDNDAGIWRYTNKDSVFKSNKKVKIKINNKKIKVSSLRLDLIKWVKKYEWYDSTLKFLLEETHGN